MTHMSDTGSLLDAQLSIPHQDSVRAQNWAKTDSGMSLRGNRASSL
eukprot:CAMPEP_0202061776 /NCGR_PEP_ID=MMETSP0963-20130614/42112_1 /ASSEMBLY_ACC=CAM_ASM_000494 /TAXON_ID=4773 /ORGANISM="Schizochytrium aggregatum, Strain ATCC28209" /LENGTH=45 /DNA_ID= /DNA_START= /DNA_END= /DNA_ORIENTATION=